MREAMDCSENEEVKASIQEEYNKEALKLSKYNAEYNKFCEDNGLKRLQDRINVAKWNRMEAAKARSAVNKTKSVDKLAENGIIKMESDEVVEFKNLGKIDIQPLEAEFGKLRTDEIIVTDERIEHIKIRHPEDFELFEKYGVEAVTKPDIIIKDQKNNGTVFMVKKLEDTNLNVVVRLVLETDNKNFKNSVMTFYRIRQKNLYKLEKKNKVLYKRV